MRILKLFKMNVVYIGMKACGIYIYIIGNISKFRIKTLVSFSEVIRV